MSPVRGWAVLIAIAAGCGLVVSPWLIISTIFMFDDPAGRGWPVYLMAGSMWVAPCSWFTALNVALVCLWLPSATLLKVAALIPMLPIAGFAIGTLVIVTMCDGRFACLETAT